MEALAWPAVVLILGLIAIFVFRSPLTRFLDRAQKISKTGIETSGAQDTGVVVRPSPADDLLKQFDNALLVQRETFIISELDRLKIGPGGERERVLIRLLAGFSIIQAFEKAYMLIWGSQIAALQSLNSSGSIDAELLRPWYDQAAAGETELYAAYTFEQWLGFLQRNSLIIWDSGRVQITVEGREFLKYLLHQGYSLYKRG